MFKRWRRYSQNIRGRIRGIDPARVCCATELLPWLPSSGVKVNKITCLSREGVGQEVDVVHAVGQIFIMRVVPFDDTDESHNSLAATEWCVDINLLPFYSCLLR